MLEKKTKLKKIFSICTLVFMVALLIDIIVLYNFRYIIDAEKYMNMVIRMRIEALIFVIAFYFLLIFKACRGELLLYKQDFPNQFPFKKYLIISSIIILVLELCYWIPRFIAYGPQNEKGFWPYIIIFLLILFSYMIICDILMLSFYASYSIVKYQIKKKEKISSD